MNNKRDRNRPPQLKTPVAAALGNPPQQQTIQQQVVEQRTVFDPDVVKAYEAMQPGAAGRLLTILEANNASEREARTATLNLQELSIRSQARDNERRDWMAYSLIVLSFLGTGFFAYLDMVWLSGGTFVATVAYVALGFFKWRQR